MFKVLTKERKTIFVAGAATGLAVWSFLKTKTARKIAVKGVANGIMLKDKIMENVANIREEADDICAEAKQVAKQSCDEEVCQCLETVEQ